MKKYRAIGTNYQTQGFEMLPSMAEFYKRYGMTAHGGYDWAAVTGEGVFWDCDIDGVVLNTEIDSSGGLGVNVITESEEGIFKHRFWHLKDFYVKAGDKVQMGDLLGWADNTGASTGTHLHEDMKEMVKDSNGGLVIKNYGNGTYGTIRYEKWFENKYVLETAKGKNTTFRRVLIEIIKRLLK